MTLRVTHAPVNVAGIPWENVQALRRKGVDARLVVFNRGKLHPEADWSLDRSGGLPRRLATQFAALARLLPRTDIFHFYFGLTLVPPSLQFPILHATRKRSVFHYLGSDIRGKRPEELTDGKRADAEIVGSYAALRWVPGANVVPPGLDLSPFTPAPAERQPAPARRPRAVEPREEGHALRDRGLRAAAGRARHRRGRQPRGGARALRPRRHRRRPAERRLARRLRARGDGARQAGGREARPRDGRAKRARATASASRSSPRRRRTWPRRCGRSSRIPPSAGRSAPRAAPTSSRCTTSTASRIACSRSTLLCSALARELKRLGSQSAIYGLGGIVSRLIAVFLLPSTPSTSARSASGRSRRSSRSRPCS